MMGLLSALVVSSVVVALVAGPSQMRPPRRRPVRHVGRPPSSARFRHRAEGVLPSIRALDDGEILGGLAGSAVLGLFVPPLVLAGPLVLAAEAVRRERAATARARRAVVEALPEMIDLLGLAVGAGLSLPAALRHVPQWLPGPVAPLIDDTLVRLDAGSSLTEALAHLGRRLPSTARRPITVIVAATRDGAPLSASLARAADEARRSQRRDAEVRARRLPVLMLLPLVACVLPAFVLLTLVPLVVGSLDGLSLTDGFPAP